MILAALRSEQLGQPSAVTAGYAVTVRSLIAVIAALNIIINLLRLQAFGHRPSLKEQHTSEKVPSRAARQGEHDLLRH